MEEPGDNAHSFVIFSSFFQNPKISVRLGRLGGKVEGSSFHHTIELERAPRYHTWLPRNCSTADLENPTSLEDTRSSGMLNLHIFEAYLVSCEVSGDSQEACLSLIVESNYLSPLSNDRAHQQ